MNKQDNYWHSSKSFINTTSLADASPAQLAFLALNGSYGEKLVATMLLESTCRAEASERRLIARPEASQSQIQHAGPKLPSEGQAFPKGRWT